MSPSAWRQLAHEDRECGEVLAHTVASQVTVTGFNRLGDAAM